MTEKRALTPLRIATLLAGGLFVVALIYVVEQAIVALRALKPIELERDSWQRPADIAGALDLKLGDTVVDLGSGVGYFTLKLSPIVGAKGTVVASDIREEALAFLWIRTVLKGASNVRVTRADVDDPRIPVAPVDAVLILNTYHELEHPDRILAIVLAHMKPGGRLVVVDRAPRRTQEESHAAAVSHHEVTAATVERELEAAGFAIASRDDRFIDRPSDDDIWWLIAAAKPD